MIATYSAKSQRRYRYYICQTAREKGWKFCTTKSVSADLLEGSLLIQLRSELRPPKRAKLSRFQTPNGKPWSRRMRKSFRESCRR